MELIDAIRRRKSIRAFRPKPVSKDDLVKIIEAAIRAPSKGNSQIWEFVVVTGDTKKELDKILLERLRNDFIPSMELGDSDDLLSNEALIKAQRRSSSNKSELKEVLSPLGLSVEEFMLEGTFTFFGAPAAILVFVDEAFSKDLPHILSIGAAVQNILLTAVDMELGACWIGGVWRYTPDIRTFLGIPNNKRLFSSVALGYPDKRSPINDYKSSRDSTFEFVRWIGLDE